MGGEDLRLTQVGRRERTSYQLRSEFPAYIHTLKGWVPAVARLERAQVLPEEEIPRQTTSSMRIPSRLFRVPLSAPSLPHKFK